MLLLNHQVKLATFEACLDVICSKGHTPYIQANTLHPDYEGMAATDPSGIIVLSISGDACMGFVADLDSIRFSVTAGQQRHQILVPMDALASIYAKEDPNIGQPLPFLQIGVDSAQKVDTLVPAKPKRQGFSPRLIKGGKA